MDDEERAELIRRLFYVMTARLEDALALATDGQARDTEADVPNLAGRVLGIAGEIAIVAEATAALATPPAHPAAGRSPH